MNAPQEEASEFAKVSKRENRVYVGNLAYDVKYGDLIEFMKPGGWKRFSCLIWSWLWFGGLGMEVASACLWSRGRAFVRSPWWASREGD